MSRSSTLEERTGGTSWQSMTWDRLGSDFTDSAQHRGMQYQREGRVENLAISSEGQLEAEVQGTEVYYTQVSLVGQRVKSTCTCYVGINCKHGAAVVAEYLHQRESGAEIDDGSQPPEGKDRKRGKRTGGTLREKIRRYVESLPHERLCEIVCQLAEENDELRTAFKENIEVASLGVDKLLKRIRRDIDTATSQDVWYDSWSRERNLPDFGPIQLGLEHLAAQGYHDHVVELGRELMRAALEQAEYADDEGESVAALAECLTVVYDSVLKSSSPPSERILFAIDATLNDWSETFEEMGRIILNENWPREDWSQAADCLLARLEGRKPKRGDWQETSDRDRTAAHLATVLERAGRNAEILPLLEREATATGSYKRLVAYLLRENQLERAEQWAQKGIAKTRRSAPGTAAHLAVSLCEIARLRGQWDVVAAFAAWWFFESPGVEAFRELMQAAGKAGCEPAVRTAALRFLETGESLLPGKQRAEADPSWPLPHPEVLANLALASQRRATPHIEVLLEIALAEKRHDDVLLWYERLGEGKRAAWDNPQARYAETVAQAVSGSHPDRALAIYQQRLNETVGPASPSNYEDAARLLRQMRPIYQSLSRDDDFRAQVAELRQKYKNRPRFLEAIRDADRVGSRK